MGARTRVDGGAVDSFERGAALPGEALFLTELVFFAEPFFVTELPFAGETAFAGDLSSSERDCGRSGGDSRMVPRGPPTARPPSPIQNASSAAANGSALFVPAMADASASRPVRRRLFPAKRTLPLGARAKSSSESDSNAEPRERARVVFLIVRGGVGSDAVDAVLFSDRRGSSTGGESEAACLAFAGMICRWGSCG